MTKRIIPFKWMPGSWGLKGQAYAEAEAAYLFEGEELDRRLAAIRLADNPDALFARNLELDVKYGHKTAYEAERLNVLRAFPEENEAQAAALAQLERAHGKITDLEFAKRMASINKQPWVGIKDSGFDSSQGVNGMFFELDWNEEWIELLRQNGYAGNSEEQVVEQWFGDISRGVADQTPDIGSVPSHRRPPNPVS